VNGCASVVGTVLAVIVAMTWGFRVVLVASIALYGLGVVAMRSAVRAPR